MKKPKYEVGDPVEFNNDLVGFSGEIELVSSVGTYSVRITQIHHGDIGDGGYRVGDLYKYVDESDLSPG
jgi:hypothetical protein